MAAPAPDTRRRGTGSPRRPRSTASPSRSGVPRWTWYVVAGVLLLAAYLLWRRRGSSGALNTSGTPGPDLTGSAAQQPNGGASSVPGNLPTLVSQPDPVTGQVQTTDTTSVESPTTITSDAYTQPSSDYSTPSPSPYTIAGGLDPAIATAINNPGPEFYTWSPTLTQAQTQAAETQAHAATVAAQGSWTAGF